MDCKLKNTFFTILLTSTLMLPYLGSFSHLFEDHKHKTCSDFTTHIHAIDFDCDILEYNFTPQLNLSLTGFRAFTPYNPKHVFSHLYLRFPSKKILRNSLRGPPQV